MGQRMKNKEEETRKYLIGWSHIVNLTWDEEAQSGLAFGHWLTRYAASGQEEPLQGHERYLSLDLLMWQPRQE